MANLLKNFHQIFIKNKVKGLTNAEAYLEARQFHPILKDKPCTDESANVSGCLLAKKLRKEIEEAIDLKKYEVETRENKRRQDVKRIFEYDLTTREGVLNSRSTFTSLLVQDYHIADMQENAPFKASVAKTISDLLKLDIPENINLSKIDYSKPTDEVLKNILVAMGGNEKSLQVALKGFEGKIKKELSEMKEGNAILKELEKGE